ATGSTHAANGGIPHDVFSMVVPESRTQVRVNSLGHDTVMTVQRADGVVIFSNDDSTVGGADAAADRDPPPGTYYVYVAEFRGAAGVPFILTMSRAPMTLPNLASTPLVTGNLGGNESVRLFRIDLTAGASRIDMTTNANG